MKLQTILYSAELQYSIYYYCGYLCKVTILLDIIFYSLRFYILFSLYMIVYRLYLGLQDPTQGLDLLSRGLSIGGFGGSLFTYVVLHLYYICIIYRIMFYLKLLTILYICFPFCLTVCCLFLHIVNKLVTLPSVHVISTSNR